MSRALLGAISGVVGVGLLSIGLADATNRAEPEFQVEALPVPVDAPPVSVRELSDAEVGEGTSIVKSIAGSLEREYPALGKLTVSATTPVYVDDVAEPIGVSSRLELSAPTNVTMDLVRTLVDADGTQRSEVQRAEISNLKGLIVDIDLRSGEVISLYPAPFASDVDDPENETRVRVLDAEEYRLYPDGDPRGVDE